MLNLTAIILSFRRLIIAKYKKEYWAGGGIWGQTSNDFFLSKNFFWIFSKIIKLL